MKRIISNVDKQPGDKYDILLTLLKEVRGLNENLKEQQNRPLKEKEVLDMLGIGAKTLRSYRTNGLLAYSKIGNRFFYRQSDIDRMLNNARIESDNSIDAHG